MGLAAAIVVVGFAAGAQWSYSGSTGPENWGALDPAYEECAQGTKQSPIELEPAVAGRNSKLEFDYREHRPLLENVGKELLVPWLTDSAIHLGGERFRLLQFHFHAPGEHAVGGNRSRMELHLVHQNPAGQIAVVAVRIQAGSKPNAAYSQLMDSIPARSGKKVRVEQPLDPAKLLPRSPARFTYPGSLTTPPCSQGVLWDVMKSPVTLSEAQIRKYERVFEDNARPLQPRGTRQVTSDP